MQVVVCKVCWPGCGFSASVFVQAGSVLLTLCESHHALMHVKNSQFLDDDFKSLYTQERCRTNRVSQARTHHFQTSWTHGNRQATRDTMKVNIKKWNAVATWRWDLPEDDVCGICQVHFDGTCPTCKYPGDDCSLCESFLNSTASWWPSGQFMLTMRHLPSIWQVWSQLSHGQCQA